MVIGGGLVLCGALIALGVGRSFEAPDETEDRIEDEERAHPLLGLKALLPPAMLLFYVFAVDRLGFLPTAAAVILVIALALGAGWRLALPVAALAPLGLHLLFAKLLRVPLPDGLLAAPW
jgi:putative tricarboxylic transport membrane protein